MAVKKTKSSKAENYTAKNIDIQEGTDGIRHSITMYLGELGDAMIARINKEPRDNSYDEYIAGRNNFIEQISNVSKNEYFVADGGNGIPIGMKTLKSGVKINTLTAIFTMAHAGGKMNNAAYKSSSGTHGVGCAAANAACLELEVYTRYEGKWYYQKFNKGEPVAKVKVVKSIPKAWTSFLTKKPTKYGTIVRMVPDQTVVSVDAEKGSRKKKNLTTAKLNLTDNELALEDLAMINHKLEVTSTAIDAKGKATTNVYVNKKDIGEFVRVAAESNELKMDARTPFMIDNEQVSMALSWTSSTMESHHFRSYVNASITIDHGTHFAGMRDAIFNALKPYMPKGKGKGNAIKANSILFGAVGFINWRMHGAQYDSQVKDKLVSKVDKEVRELLEKPLAAYFAKNKTLAKKIIKRAEQAEKAQEQLKNTMQKMTEVRKKSRNQLPECLISCPDAKPELRELFLVEGDSAGGTAKYARDADYQEIFKLRGKVMNCLEAPLDKILASPVIQNLIIALGLDLKDLDLKSDKPQFSADKLRVQYVCMLTDADPDGFHIANLLSSFFYRLCPDFIKQGRLRFVATPLFVTEYKGVHYGAMATETTKDKDGNKVVGLNEILPKNAKYNITRAKGLGELNPDQLKTFGFDPASRIEIRINYFQSAQGEKWYRDITAESTVAKRKLLGIPEAA